MATGLRASHGLGLTLSLILVLALGYVLAPHLSAAWNNGSARFPSDVDIGFAQDMSVHHEQAVLMASLARSRAGPAIQAMSDAILLGQSQQIGTMRGWLQLWGEPPVANHPMTWSPHHDEWRADKPSELQTAGDGLPLMAGMASASELTSLWAASGDAFDVLFLKLMIRHHMGGVDMAHHATEFARMRPVQELAKVMVVQQVHELAQMQRLLAVHGERPLPFPQFAMCRIQGLVTTSGE